MAQTKKALLVDITRCIGCRACETACKEKNGLPMDDGAASGEPRSNRGERELSATTYNVVQERSGRFVRNFCRHCNEPTCASVCPVGAFTKLEAGPVVYDEDKCMGCRYCMMACPFHIPRYEWNRVTPRVRKCTFCADRVAQGKPTACSEACPVGATTFGDRDVLIAEAQARIRENPNGYVNHVYGVEEAGGTSMLFLSDVPFEQLGMRVDLPREPLPLLTFRVLSKIPDIVVLGGVMLGGIWWITHRREEVAKAEGAERQAASAGVRKPGGPA